MLYYPVFLTLHSRDILVVGGGRVAERKIKTLIRAGAKVTVIAPQATAAIRRWSASDSVRWEARPYESRDARSRVLIFSATDHPEVDARVASDARHRGIPVNCAGLPEQGTFLVPAQYSLGPVQIAVSTGGASPALARKLASELGASLGRDFGGREIGKLASLLGSLRPLVRKTVPRSRRASLWDDLTMDLVQRRRPQRAQNGALRLAMNRIEKEQSKAATASRAVLRHMKAKKARRISTR